MDAPGQNPVDPALRNGALNGSGAARAGASFRLIPRFVNRLKTLQTQTLLVTLALLLVLVGLTAVLGAWVTHRLKQHLVAEAREYAREEVARSCREIQDIMERKGVQSVEAAANLPEVNQRISMILKRSDGTIQMVAILGPEGTIVRRFHNNQCASIQQVGSDMTVEGPVEGTDANFTLTVEQILSPDPPAQQTAQAAVSDVPAAGYLAFQMAENLGGSDRIQRLSGAVTGSLGWMVLLLLAILAAAMTLLYKVFNRHLALEKEKDVQAKMAAIGTLASGLAHEIRNPLQVINMNLDVIREDIEEQEHEAAAEDRARTFRILTGVQGQISHLNQILGDFMQFAIPGRLEKEELSLRALLADTLEFMTPELVRNAVDTEIQVAGDLRVEGDPSALRRVFLNVFLNAVRAMENAPVKRLAVGAERMKAGWWEVWIEDTGGGIPEGKEEEIFDAFVSFRPGGSGFGLAIARRIIEDHGGHIRADRRPPGAGAIFRIALPALEPEGQPAARPRQSTPATDLP